MQGLGSTDMNVLQDVLAHIDAGLQRLAPGYTRSYLEVTRADLARVLAVEARLQSLRSTAA